MSTHIEGLQLDPQPLHKRLNNLWWEFRLGIRTRGIVDVTHPDAYHYATMFYSTIRKVLDRLSLTPDDTFVDIGCGKGRVVCLAALHNVKRVIGVELSADFCTVAEANSRALRGRRAEIEIHNISAQNFDYSGGTVLFLFNPFGAGTLDDVLQKISSEVTDKSRLRIAYANPAHDDVFARHAWLDQYEHWNKQALGLEHSVSFYRAKR